MRLKGGRKVEDKFDNHALVFKIMGIMSNEDDRRIMIYMQGRRKELFKGGSF